MWISEFSSLPLVYPEFSFCSLFPLLQKGWRRSEQSISWILTNTKESEVGVLSYFQEIFWNQVQGLLFCIETWKYWLLWSCMLSRYSEWIKVIDYILTDTESSSPTSLQWAGIVPTGVGCPKLRPCTAPGMFHHSTGDLFQCLPVLWVNIFSFGSNLNLPCFSLR